MQETLRRENMVFFDEKFPEVAEKLRANETLLSSVAYDAAGQPVDLDLGGKGYLYKEDARLFSERQVDNFFSHPRVILLNRPAGAGTIGGEISDDFNIFLGEKLNEIGIWEISQLPLVPSGLMVVLGVGLGLHLSSIAEKVKNHTVVIVEPIVEFLSHSLSFIDWRELWERLDNAGRNLKVIVEGDPRRVNQLIDGILMREDVPSLDGTYVYTHYSSWIFDEVATRLSSDAYHYFIARGFYEDEIKMLSQTTRNFLNRDFYLIEGKNRLARSEPIFVVGSGASIDKTLDTIRKWQGHAVIFSGGTALRVLLSNGIRPDYHCELENGEPTYDVLSRVKDEFGLDGIKLIASSTVSPKAAALFDEVNFFFRDSVSSTMIFAKEGGYVNIEGAAPTCTNTALSVATILGFQEIYLFGLDCGVRDPERHHSTSSVYYTDHKLSKTQFKFPIELPGNFGGKAYTNWVYDLTRRMIEGLQRYQRIRMFNCSDGALINGVTPKVARSVKLTTVLDKEKIFDSIRAENKHFAPGEFFHSDKKKYSRFSEAFDKVAEEVNEWLDTLHDICADVNDFCREAVRFTGDINARHLAVSQLISATTHNIPKIAQFYLLRIEDSEKREKIFHEMLDEYARLVRKMLTEGRELYAELAREVDTVASE